MSEMPSKNPELNDAEPVVTKPVAAIRPAASASPVAKARTAARTAKAPVAAKAKPAKPVATVAMAPVAAASGAPGKARTRATPAAAARPKAAPVQGDKVLSGTKAPAQARAAKAVAEVLAPTPGQAKPFSEGKKSKEAKQPGKKSRLVRDSFTFPAADYALIALLKQRALKSGHEVKKSELLRVGLRVLFALSDATLVKALGSIDKLKPGRPSK